MRLELIGFGPDLDPATPGVLTDCGELVPTTSGFSAANSRVSAGLPALAQPVQGAFVAKLLDGTKRVFAGTQAALWEASGTSWVDRSKAGGYASLARWRFETFGNATIATNRGAPLQQSIGDAFADIAGAPVASLVVAASGFLMALDASDGGAWGDNPDGWWCSGLFDQTVWTPSVATQSARGRLVDSPGKITAARALGDDVVAYKATSMYLGRYVGPPVIWSWQRVPGEIGASSQEAVVVVDTRHFFIGPNDFYVFDGTVPRPIGAPVRDWFFANLNGAQRDKIIGVADLPRDLVYWYFPSAASTDGTPDMALVYNIRKDQWGKITGNIQAALEYSSGQITYAGMGALAATYDQLPTIAYDSPFWLADQSVPGVFGTDAVLYSVTGTPGASFYVTGDYGDETRFSMLRRVTPRFRTAPATGTGTNFYRGSLGEVPVQDANAQLARGRFDFRRAARWHRFRADHTGPMSLNGLDVDLVPGSLE